MNNYISTELQKFNITDTALAEMKEKYIPMVIPTIEHKAEYLAVKDARAIVKSKRIEVEKKRKELKEDSLKFGRAIDAEAKRITIQLSEIEDRLTNQIDFVDNELERIKKEKEAERKLIIDARFNKLREFNFEITTEIFRQIQTMNDDDFSKLASQAEDNHRIILEQQENERIRLEEDRRQAEELKIKLAQAEEELKRIKSEVASQDIQDDPEIKEIIVEQVSESPEKNIMAANNTNIDREKLTLNAEEARDILWEDHADFKIIEKNINERSRWDLCYELIIQRKDGKYFRTFFNETFSEDGPDVWESDEPDFNEVFPVQKTITVYE